MEKKVLVEQLYISLVGYPSRLEDNPRVSPDNKRIYNEIGGSIKKDLLAFYKYHIPKLPIKAELNTK